MTEQIIEHVKSSLRDYDFTKMFQDSHGESKFLEGFDGLVTVVDNYPGQANIIAVFVDWTIEKPRRTLMSSEHDGKHYEHYSANFALDRRDIAMAGLDKLDEKIKSKVSQMMSEVRQVGLGEQSPPPTL